VQWVECSHADCLGGTRVDGVSPAGVGALDDPDAFGFGRKFLARECTGQSLRVGEFAISVFARKSIDREYIRRCFETVPTNQFVLGGQ
jgi:hypothetical protein